MHAIVVNGLEKRFGEILALDHVSFTVETGEVFGYLGPNGAGKTTTIRILTGITSPSGGSATIFGSDIVRDTIQARRNMGIVYETSNIYDDITAWQNMMFAGELYHVGKEDRESRGKELLEVFGLWDRRASRVKGFSKGMKRRLTLAMGLINDPKLLFLDEPTSGLDVQSNLIIRDVLRSLTERGVTVFLTTHNIEEANQTCDRVAIINRGRIAAIDSPERLKKTIQSVQSVEVAFEHGGAQALSALSGLPMVSEARKVGDKVRLYTEDPGGLLREIVSYADSHQDRVVSATTFGPTLEDVFIRLTGLRRPKDGREEP
ncbi:MAG: Trehalose/maltose import ATP-binding protein MalK [Methanoregulaceae archaeon PtaB.Bin056]|nr:MAG: Trehalose/maltose import ATP-binding protein MalK [Methanoregulaceae archaeon PtaB.Bin056]